jgi:hypothetical protein
VEGDEGRRGTRSWMQRQSPMRGSTPLKEYDSVVGWDEPSQELAMSYRWSEGKDCQCLLEVSLVSKLMVSMTIAS